MAGNRPHVVIVTASIHAIGASLFAYAMAPALGDRRSLLRASSDPLSPLLRNYLRYERTGAISSHYHPNEVSYPFRGPLEADAVAVLTMADQLKCPTVLWDISGPACASIKAEEWRDLAIQLEPAASVTCFTIAGLSQWSKRYLGLVAGVFPRTIAVANLLLGRRESFPKDYPIAVMPSLEAGAVQAIDTHTEALDDLAKKAVLTTGQRASLSAFGEAVAAATTYLPPSFKDTHEHA